MIYALTYLISLYSVYCSMICWCLHWEISDKVLLNYSYHWKHYGLKIWKTETHNQVSYSMQNNNAYTCTHTTYIMIHVPSMLAKGVETNNKKKHNKQAATMAYKIHKTQLQRA